LLDAGVAAKDIPLPHEFILNPNKMAELYPSFKEGLTPFFTLNWGVYADFLTFKGGLNPQTAVCGYLILHTITWHWRFCSSLLAICTGQTGALVTA